MTEQFPILLDAQERREHPDWPISVPWSIFGPREREQAEVNHYQTLERLAERGGLSPYELLLVLTGQKWGGRSFQMHVSEEREKYNALVQESIKIVAKIVAMHQEEPQ